MSPCAPAAGRGARRLVPLPILALGLLVAFAGTGCGGGERGAGVPEPPTASSHPLAEPYLRVAFGNRWGEPAPVLRKWGVLVTVRVSGAPRYEDRVHLRRLVGALGEVPGLVAVELLEWETVEDDGGTRGVVEVAYLPRDRFEERLPGANGEYPAHFVCRSGEGGSLEGGVLLVPADDVYPQYMRDDLVQEGLLACLGLAGGLDAPHESVFQEAPNWNEGYLTPLDLRLLALHYRPELPVGLSQAEAARRLGLAGEPVAPSAARGG